MGDPEDRAIVRNREALLSHGPRRLRSDALDIVEAGIRGADAGAGTRRLVRLDGDVLHVGGREFRLADRRVFVVGAGKGSLAIAAALDELLSERITTGVVVVKRGHTRRLKRIEAHEAGHPIPDDASVEGARKIAAVLDRAGKGDLVLAAVTGGASALALLPPEGVSLADVQAVTKALLNSGAVIQDINTVRRHLCQLKGGRLVARAAPAEVVTLTLDTAHPGMPWPDPCLPDPTTFADAVAVLRGRGLWEQTPEAVRRYLEEGTSCPERETLKSLDGLRSSIVYVGSPAGACDAAAAKAEALGYPPAVLATYIEGEAKDVGLALAGIANEIAERARPFAPPCAVITGGEATVTVTGDAGTGGPNQETALSFARAVCGDERIAFCAVDTDGTDGPTDIAGGLIDGGTAGRAARAGVDLAEALRRHGSSAALTRLGEAVVTGHTDTNVMNLRVVLIAATEGENT